MKTNLQALRKAAGFKSAKSFAEHMGMNVNTYTDYEQGRRLFTLDKAWEFADVLNCTLDELAGRKSPTMDDETSAFAERFQRLSTAGRQAVMEMVELQQFKSSSMQNNQVSGVA